MNIDTDILEQLMHPVRYNTIKDCWQVDVPTGPAQPLEDEREDARDEIIRLRAALSELNARTDTLPPMLFMENGTTYDALRILNAEHTGDETPAQRRFRINLIIRAYALLTENLMRKISGI